MTRGEISVIPEYFTLYTNLIPTDINIHVALKRYGIDSVKAEMEQYKELGDQIYAPGKWTTKETLVHIIDAERVFAYRALRFARGDQAPLVGFEQDDYVANAGVINRTIEDIVEEFIAVRESTIHLFSSFDEDILAREGIASGNPVSVLALGFMSCGHLVHHQNIFVERYYPLLAK